ncbi:MAG: tRNA (guanine(46)-N(7))-methyltransferase TrmB [Opitutales bacterium]
MPRDGRSRPDAVRGERSGRADWQRLVAERRARLRANLAAWAGAMARRFSPEAGCILELGCGHGHWLTAYASAHPERPCLGIDRISKRIRKATAKAEKRHLDHLAFIKADSLECLSVWPTEWPIREAFMLFPDPWPKKRHQRRRMLQPRLLSQLARHVPAGGRFHFRTDHPAYFEWSRDILGNHPAWATGLEARWPFEAPSFFQDLLPNYRSLSAVRTETPCSGRDDPAWLSENPVEGGHQDQLADQQCEEHGAG